MRSSFYWSRRRTWLSGVAPLAVALTIVICFRTANAQPRPLTPPASKSPLTKSPLNNGSTTPAGVSTTVSVEILTGREGVGLRAHRWLSIFEKMGVSLKIRTATLDEKPGISETKAGRSRIVVVTGRLTQNGGLQFADRTFGEADAGKLSTWIKELKTYGSQGNPDAQPIWGLTKAQFRDLFSLLGEPVGEEVKGEGFAAAIDRFHLSNKYPLRYSEKAQTVLAPIGRKPVVRQNVKGVAKGTALAAMLSEISLVIRPHRDPDGNITLLVQQAGETREPWPVGWPIQKSPGETAPKLHQFVEVDLEDIELDAVLETAADLTGIPILIDHAGLEGKGVKIESVKVSHPPKRTTWAVALRQLTFAAKAKHDLLLDEAGRPFLLVSPVNSVRTGGLSP